MSSRATDVAEAPVRQTAQAQALEKKSVENSFQCEAMALEQG